MGEMPHSLIGIPTDFKPPNTASDTTLSTRL